jgi:PAS domain S-box-containing protein
MLEQRVREQTAELSQTVVRLQQELAESKRAHRALGVSESRFRGLYECHFIGVAFWDGAGKITDANDAFLRFIGYTRDDLARGLIQLNVISPAAPRNDPAVEDTVDTRPRKPNERDFVRKDGSRTTLLFSTSPFEGAAAKNVGFAVKHQ